MKRKRIWVVIIISLLFVVAAFVFLNRRQQQIVTPPKTKRVSFFSISPGQSTREDVKNSLGQPISSATFNGLPQENYQSNSQVHPHEVVYEGERVVFIREIITNQNEKTLADIRSEFGIAPYTLYSQEYGISFPLFVYPNQGLATIGNSETGDLLEVWYFEPTSFEEFRAQWAPALEYTEEPEIIQ